LAKDFGARDQLRRSAISISNNIAEGFEYNNNNHLIRFLLYSKGSAGELRSNLFVLKEAGMIDAEVYDELRVGLISVSGELQGYIKYLRKFEEQKAKLDAKEGT
jgi:four helix bundle protein